MFHDKRVVECARLLAAECDASNPSARLYGEGLTVTLPGAPASIGSPRKRVPAYRLRDSTSFSTSFMRISMPRFRFLSLRVGSIYPPRNSPGCSKASTGITPHRYQVNTRIEKAQDLLLTKGESLSMVAAATGFVRSEPLHADVQERNHWNDTARVASESYLLENGIGQR